MCFPTGSGQAQNLPAIPSAPLPPSRTSMAVERRVEQVTGRNEPSRQAQTVLTSPLGDPKYGSAISRTVLTGILA